MPTKTKKIVKKSPVKKVTRKKPAKPAKAPGKVVKKTTTKRTKTKAKTKKSAVKTPVKKAKKDSKIKEFLKAKQVQLVAGLALIAAVWVLFMPQRATGISYFETWRLSAGESIKMQLGRK